MTAIDKTMIYETMVNEGFVRLVDSMGDDHSIVRAARVSYGQETKGDEQDKKLIHYLLAHDHMTPFEMVNFTFHIKCPIFVMRQWIRHRISSFSEISGRYVEMKDEFFIPKQARIQAKKNKQGSTFANDDFLKVLNQTLKDANQNAEFFHSLEEWNHAAISTIEQAYDIAYKHYQYLISIGVARELARVILPLGLYTEFYWTINLRSLMNFLTLRTDDTAQQEIHDYALVIKDIVAKIVPWTFEAL